MSEDIYARLAHINRQPGFDARGQYGFSVSAQNAGNQQILYWDEDHARGWTIHLVGMNYQGGTIATPPAGVATGLPETPDGSAVAVFQAAIDFGAYGISESVVVDYPWTGCSFEVTAASLKLRFLQPTNIVIPGTLPLIGAYAVPSIRGSGVGDKPPTLTTLVNLPPSTFGTLQIPARARSYTLGVIDNLSTSLPFYAQQQNAAGTLIYRMDNNNVAMGANVQAYTGGQYNFPIHPWATNLQLQNSSGVSTLNLLVRFELDLG